jgi:DNA polymerase III epsilon subunit-like protein
MMKLTPVYLDFETWWNEDHTLSKMSPIEYVMSPKTEIISMSIKVGDNHTDVFFGEDKIRHILSKHNWSNKMVIGHNMSGFDSMILAWRFGVRPAMWGCTAAMARSKYAKTCGVSLKALVKELGVGEKVDAILHSTKGKRLADFTEAERDAMAEYNKADTEQCAALFKKLVKGFPKDELLLIHLTTQMLVNPRFVLDTGLVETALSIERSEKHKALLELAKLLRSDKIEIDWSDEAAVAEFVRSEMASAPRFAKLLESQGVEVPMKPSPTDPTKQVPALAKTDEAFLKLQDHKNPLVAAAARTRLSVKSTILETRLEAFLRAGAACGGKLPVPLKYCGADTTGRWSGEHYNMQSLPRITPGKPKTSDALRNSLKAPKGHKIVVADLSGIELRVNHFLWKVEQSMDLYAKDAEADLYKAFAAARYGIKPEDVSKEQRQLAKVAQLGLGFGAGATTFQKVAKLMGGLELSAEEAKEVVDSWRATYHAIVKGWRACHDALPYILEGTYKAIDPWGMCETELGAIRLPSGRRIYYPALRTEVDTNGKKEWWYGEGRHKARIYAGKITENLVQALARDVMADITVRLYKLYKFEPCLLVHDEYVMILPEREAESGLRVINDEMRKPPKWWPELILHSEGDIGDSYGQCK